LLVMQPHLVARRYRALAERLSGFRLHYAVKALPHPIVLTTIALCGGGFDVATSAEVDLLQQLGLPMDRCIHTNPIKKPADIDHAYAAGIRTFVVENPCEAQKFAVRPDDIDLLVRLAFRNPTAKSDLSSKFGVEPAAAELLVKHVIAAGVHFAGFSFHIGSQSSTAEPYGTALRETSPTASACAHA
jgi:ornithine decarboxylase